jgi:RNA binding exosome subunit
VKQTVSKLFKNYDFVESKSYDNLTPVMKEVVKDIFEIIDEDDTNIIENIDKAVDDVSRFHNVDKQEILNYFDNEVKEQLGV